MDMTNNPTAALRSRSESSFVVPSGAQAFWHVASNRTHGMVSSNDVFIAAGTARVARDLPTGTTSVNHPPMTARYTRITAKQASPPRGEPR